MSRNTSTPISLALPPFPPLAWDGYFWSGRHTLRSWAGFQSRGGSYAARSSRRRSTGDVAISINVGTQDDGTPHLPTAAQRQAFQYLQEHESAITSAVLKRILRAYPGEREESIDAAPELEDVLPVIKNVKQLRDVIGLGTVHVLSVMRSDRAYIGFELGCEWDDEHGFGIMTHGARVVAHGGADHAFLEWVAERDAKPRGKR